MYTATMVFHSNTFFHLSNSFYVELVTLHLRDFLQTPQFLTGQTRFLSTIDSRREIWYCIQNVHLT